MKRLKEIVIASDVIPTRTGESWVGLWRSPNLVVKCSSYIDCGISQHYIVLMIQTKPFGQRMLRATRASCRSKIFEIVVLVLGAIVTNGCYQTPSEPITKQEVPGQYMAEAIDYQDILQIESDGTYRQQYLSPQDDTVTNSGTWEYSGSFLEGQYNISLIGYRPLNPEWINELPFSFDNPAASFELTIDKRREQIRAWLSYDFACSYLKVL